jgi:hypothetical protein
VQCHWGATVWDMVKIMEKNYFAAVDYRTGLVLAGSLFLVLVLLILTAGFASGRAVGILAGVSPLCLIAPGIVLASRMGWAWACAVFLPFMFPVFLYAVLNSTYLTLRQGGIRWRHTFYSLAELRKGNVQ